MLIATMRAEFVARCLGLADDLTDAQIDEHLNRQYQFAIPDDVYGQLSDGTWTETTVDGTQSYDYPVYVHHVRGGKYIHTLDDDLLHAYYRPEEMWARYEESSTDEGKPHSVLFYDGTMTLVPVPDDAYTVKVRIRAYPNDGTDLLELGDSPDVDEIENTTHALAVVSGAAAEYLADFGETELQSKDEWGRRQLYVSRLMTRSAVAPRGRRARRSW